MTAESASAETAPPEDTPHQDIEEEDILDNDILLGRGGKTNHHPGNARYLKIIESHQVKYMFIESRTEKTEFAMQLVQEFRKEGIRFLKKNTHNKLWTDVGDAKMREKVSQNLREHQPKLKEQLRAKEEAEKQLKEQQLSRSNKSNRNNSNSNLNSSNSNLNNSNSNLNNSNSSGFQPMSPGGYNQQIPLSPTQIMSASSPGVVRNTMSPSQMFQQQQFLQAQAAQQMQMQAFAQQQHQLQNQLLMRRLSGGSCGSGSGGNNAQFSPLGANMNYAMQMQMQMQMQQMAMTVQPPPLTASSSASHPIPYNAGGVPIQSLDNNINHSKNINSNDADMDPLPYIRGAPTEVSWSEHDDREAEERALLEEVGANQHRLSSLSCLQDLAESLEEQERMVEAFGARGPSLGDIDIAAAMGCSTASLLDDLRVDAVPEEEEGQDEDDDDEPLSPDPHMVARGNPLAREHTPVVSNRKYSPPFHRMQEPATVTPTPASPVQQQSGQPLSFNNCVLDDDLLKAWANSDEDDDLATDPFVVANGQSGPYGGGGHQAAPFRRHNTVEGHCRSPGDTAPFRRTYTNPEPESPFNHRTHSPGVPARRHISRKARTCPTARPQSPTADEPLSPRPASLTKEKRATSNVNETPETRRGLAFQEGPLTRASDPMAHNSDDSSSYNMSSFSSVKKASLGRDKSAQSRMLKQQCMPEVYGSPTGQGTDTISTPFGNGWSSGMSLPFGSNHSAPPAVGTASSPPPKENDSAGENNITPKTSRLMRDFGNMNLSKDAESSHNNNDNSNHSNHSRSPRTAGRFEDTMALAREMPMELMVRRPDRLMWRNRTSTIEALDLDCLDDDPVLQGEVGGSGRRPSRNSINEVASMWANLPTSEDFDALVTDIAQRRMSDLLDQPIQLGEPSGAATSNKPVSSLALPF